MDHHLRAQTLHSSIKNNCTIIFFHPDYTVGSGITPDHASRPAGFTAGRESHPALKISFFIIILYISFVKQKFGNGKLLFTLISSANFVILYV